MKRLIISTVLACLFLTSLPFCGCIKIGSVIGIEGCGHVISEERYVSGFRSIVSKGSWDLYVSQGNEESLHIEADENLISHITVTVKDDSLIISTDEDLNPSTNIRVFVTMRDVEGIKLAGSGDIIGETPIQCEHLNLQLAGSGDITFTVHAESVVAGVYGSGDIEISGRANRCQLSLFGSGDILSLDLHTMECTAEIRGSGDIKVHAEQELNAVIKGSGDILYRGSPPRVSRTILGSGDINRI